VDGARANEIEGAVPEAIKQERWEAFMQTQAAISSARLQAKIGTIQEVLVDETNENGAYARSKADAPEIDGIVHIPDGQELDPGMLIEVEIDGADEYDLTARFPG
jgi:ribosomal protein S12 methylthiotransferase